LNARQRAVNLAQGKDHEYVCGTGELLRWVFQELESVQSLFDADFADGTEVYWTFFEKLDPKPSD
jgi:hypothetical protein